jgi:hypothetical protein
MVVDPHVAVAGAMASEVAIMLKTRNISVVPVVDDHRTRRFLGTLSDRDLVTRCLAEGKHPWHTRADSRCWRTAAWWDSSAIRSWWRGSRSFGGMNSVNSERQQ